jgi:hypothetical protein
MSDELGRLIEAEKTQAPPSGAKEATWRAIESSVAAGVPAPVELGPIGGGAGPVAWIAAIIGGASTLAVVVYLALPKDEPVIVPLPPPPPPVVELVPPPPELPPPSPPVQPRKQRPKPSLAAQVQELRKAQLAFSRGQFQVALELVERHRERFRETPLEQERSALEALAACRIRREDAFRLAHRFLTKFPESPQADRVRRTCEAIE